MITFCFCRTRLVANAPCFPGSCSSTILNCTLNNTHLSLVSHALDLHKQASRGSATHVCQRGSAWFGLVCPLNRVWKCSQRKALCRSKLRVAENYWLAASLVLKTSSNNRLFKTLILTPPFIFLFKHMKQQRKWRVVTCHVWIRWSKTSESTNGSRRDDTSSHLPTCRCC